MRRLLPLLVAFALASCSGSKPPQVTAPPPAASASAGPSGSLIPAPARSSATYGTSSTPDGIRGGQEAAGVAHALVQAGAARGLELEPDGRLADLATWIASLVDDRGKAPPSTVFDFGARHIGMAEDTPVIMTLAGGTPAEREAYVGSALATMPGNIAYNRFGVASVDRNGLPVSVVVIAVSMLELEPVPRSVAVGTTLRLRGRLDASFGKYEVVVTQPDGSAKEIAERTGTVLDASIPLASPGVFRIEVLGAGPWGLTVLANFPVYAGMLPPQSLAMRTHEPQASGAAASAESTRARLFELLNDSRKQAGAPPLSTHEGLARIAEAHTRDMAEHGFFGHVSPTTGDPSNRVRAAGMRFAIVAENVGIGQSADEVHRALLDSPGHRANVLNPKLTHVGIGVTLQEHGGRSDVVATELFARIAPAINASAAPTEILARLNLARQQAGAAPLVSEGALVDVASQGASAWFRDAKLSKEQVLDLVIAGMDRQAKAGHPAWKKIGKAETFLTSVSTLDDALTFDAARNPAARFIGVGVAQGSRPDGPDNSIAVVMVVGWPR